MEIRILSKCVLGFLASLLLVTAIAAQYAAVSTRLQPRFTGLDSPVLLMSSTDRSARIFIVERAGKIKVVQRGSRTPTVFLDITHLVSTEGEGGLLGLTFGGRFDEMNDRRFYVLYAQGGWSDTSKLVPMELR